MVVVVVVVVGRSGFVRWSLVVVGCVGCGVVGIVCVGGGVVVRVGWLNVLVAVQNVVVLIQDLVAPHVGSFVQFSASPLNGV